MMLHENNSNKQAMLFKYYTGSQTYFSDIWKQYIFNKFAKAEKEFSLAHFYFKEMFVIKYERDERYSSTDAICKQI